MKEKLKISKYMFWGVLIVVVIFSALITREGSKYVSDPVMVEEVEEIVSKPLTGQLSMDLERLLSDQQRSLKLKIGDEDHYNVTPKLTRRVLENFQDSKVLEKTLEVVLETDVVLYFEGYQPIHINKVHNLFWFEGGSQVYRARYLEGVLWERCILEALHGIVQYTRFEKDTMQQYHSHVNEAHGKSDIVLYFDGDIRLDINGSDYVVDKSVDPRAIGNVKSYNLYHGRLDVIESVNSDLKLILAGYKYTFVNRYGASSLLKVFEVNGDEIVEVWDTNKMLNAQITVKSYDNEKLIVMIDGIEDELSFEISPNEASELASFDESLQEGGQILIGQNDFQFFSNLTDYRIMDYDGDGHDELLCYFYMRGGAAGVTSYLIGIYDIGINGFKLRSLEAFHGDDIDMKF